MFINESNRYIRYLFALILLGISLVGNTSPANDQQLKEILDHVDELWRGKTSHATMSMTVKTRRYERAMTMESWSKGKDYSLIVIRKPKKDQNISTLKVKENIWNYLPKINRVTKVPSSMMSGSWMGSHFTNDDLVKDSSFVDDYDSHISFSGERDGKTIYEITSIPKEDAAVVWGKVVLEIDQLSLVPYFNYFYDEEELLVRTMAFDQIKKVGDRQIPMRMTLTPEDKPNESTVIDYQNIQFDMPLKKSFFSLQNLKKRK